MKLNDEQRQAVEYCAGPQVIVAGPGSGKTRVIISKTEYLVTELGTDPSRILAITFSNKAAEEMRDRLSDSFPYRAHEFNVHTFHALCWTLVQEFAGEAGFRPGVRVLDDKSAWVLVRQHMEEFGLRHFQPNPDPFKFLFDLLKHVSRAKDEGVTTDDYVAYARSIRRAYEAEEASLSPEDAEAKRIDVEKTEELASFYAHYQELLHSANCIDFGDQISMALRLLTDHADIRKNVQSRWDYILVDEFQDTNIAQIELLKLITGPGTRVCVVGDPDQSIYRFRGASFASFTRFDQSYPTSKPFALTRNYRSTKNVLAAAAQLISNNLDRYQSEKPVWTENDEGLQVSVLMAPSFTAEAEAVADEIAAILGDLPAEERRFSDFAILYRAHSHRDEFEDALDRRGIPYKVQSGAGFYKKEEIRDVTALARCAAGQCDSVPLFRVFSLPDWQVPPSKLSAFSRWMNGGPIPVAEAPARLNECQGLDPESAAAISNALDYILRLREVSEGLTAAAVCRHILETTEVLRRYIYDDSIDSRQRAANLAKYLRRVQEFEETSEDKSIEAFVEYLGYLLDSGADEEEAEIDDTRDAVQLMTVHAAKGLEWPYVFVVCLSSQRFPTNRRTETIPFPDALAKEPAPPGDFHTEEERRLAYVAFTRAEKRLSLSCVDRKGKPASIFIREVRGCPAAIENSLDEVDFDPALEPGRKIALVERDIRRKVIGLLGESAEVDTIRPYVELLSAVRLPDVERAAAVETALAAGIAPGLREKIQDALAQQSVIETAAASAQPSPLHLSYTRMSKYEECPLSYRFSYELKIPQPPRAALSFGSTVHDTLCWYLEQIKAGNQPSLDDLKDFYRAGWKSSGYVLPSQEDGYRRDGETALETFHQRYSDAPIVPLHLEWKFTVPIGGHFITGFVDRIDPAGDGLCTVYDYKTGKPKNQKDVDKDLQLTVYALAVQEGLGLRAERLALYFLQSNEVLYTTRTDEQIEEAREKIQSVAASISSRQFEPKPDPFRCPRCDYAWLCRATEA